MTAPLGVDWNRNDASEGRLRRPPYKYGSGLLIQRQFGGAARELELRAHAQLRVDVGEVRLDGAFSDEEAFTDLAGCAALRRQPGDLPLTRAQSGQTESRGGGSLPTT